MRILVVEDDIVLGEAVQFALTLSNYAVDCVRNGLSADHALKDGVFDLLILDLGLPKLDGFEVLKRLRARNSSLPVLILSARDDADEKARGLDMGADDYLCKPFSVKELEARVRALLRRGQYGSSAAQIFRAGICYDTLARSFSINGKALDLSVREASLLEVLFNHFGRSVSKELLLERLYNYDDSAGYNAIEVYIHRLRKKLDGSNITVKTLYGRGYQLDHRE